MRFFKILLYKAYFDKGMALLNYPIKALMVIGIGAAVQEYSLSGIAFISFFIGVVSLILGRLWFHFKLIETEQEIMNIFNPFCQDVRNKLTSSPNNL